MLVPATCTLGELYGVVQVAMGWDGIHLYQFCLRPRAMAPGSCRHPRRCDAPAPRLRKGARFVNGICPEHFLAS